MKADKKTRTLRDLVLILSLLCIGLILFFILRGSMQAGTQVAVIVDNETVATYSLLADGEYPLLDGKNLLVIEEGAAYIGESECPDHLCERMGRIRKSGARIVCLPHHLTVKII